MTTPQFKTSRQCGVYDVPVILRIAHGHLNPDYHSLINAAISVENTMETRERVSFTVKVSWQGDKQASDHAELFNYTALYGIIQSLHDRLVIGPLEELVDEIFSAVQYEAKRQKITPTALDVMLKRPDLLYGHVELHKSSH